MFHCQTAKMTNWGLVFVQILKVTKISARYIFYLLNNEQKHTRVQKANAEDVFVLRFYGPVNPMGSC